MIRLAVLFHDDTREPVAVEALQRAACKDLLLRERAHWLAGKEAKPCGL